MEDIEQIIEQHIALMIAHRNNSLYDPIDYILQDGGKRMRPRLALLASDVVAGNIDDAMPSAVAIEVFHNFTLLHDDIMDNAATRRGRDTVHVKWNANSAILSGDAMMILAYDILSKSKPQYLAPLLTIFNKAALEVCEGQQLDMEFEGRAKVTLDEYINMIRLKTSALMAGAIALGATAAGATNAQCEALYNFGDNLGLAFQIQDDFLDTYGHSDTFGKKIGGDIAVGKQTFLKVFSVAKASAYDAQILVESRNFATVKGLYDKYHAKQGAQDAIEKYFDKALENLSIFEFKKIEKLKQYAYTLLNREK